MKNIDFKKVLKLIGRILRCPICGFGYNLDTMKVVESDHDESTGEARVLIYSDCKKCKGSVVFNIGVSGTEMYSASSITDLTFADTKKFEKIASLSVDDCLVIHKEVRGLDGSFFSKLAKVEAKTNQPASSELPKSVE